MGSKFTYGDSVICTYDINNPTSLDVIEFLNKGVNDRKGFINLVINFSFKGINYYCYDTAEMLSTHFEERWFESCRLVLIEKTETYDVVWKGKKLNKFW